MNENDTSPSAAVARPGKSSSPSAPRGGSIALALLLALLALLASIYVGWHQWLERRHRVADAQALHAMQQKVDVLEAALAGYSGGRATLAQRLDASDQLDRTLQAAQQAQGDRLRELEAAVGKLSEDTLSAHDATLLDETESLLRMAKERYELFHDAQGAATAYALAGQTLSAVNDAAFAGLRQNVEAERLALLASQPTSQADALATLTALRAAVPTLPLKSPDAPANASSSGAWSRIVRALDNVVSVQRDDGTPLAVADARFARELLALDLAQAQAALLAHDPAACTAALQRADARLASQFDGSADAVQQARASLKQVAGAVPGDVAVRLGAALAELRNLRAVHALSAAPAPASSAAAPAKAAPVKAVPAKGASR